MLEKTLGGRPEKTAIGAPPSGIMAPRESAAFNLAAGGPRRPHRSATAGTFRNNPASMAIRSILARVSGFMGSMGRR